MKVSAILLSGLMLLAGCTNKELYEAVQINRLNACEKLIGSQREECIESHSMPYKDYREKREELKQ